MSASTAGVRFLQRGQVELLHLILLLLGLERVLDAAAFGRQQSTA
jgi:hypothetical protein